jgi:hypothetical protein
MGVDSAGTDTDSRRKTCQHPPWQEDGRNRKERNEKRIPFPERTLGIVETSKRNPAKRERNGTERNGMQEFPRTGGPELQEPKKECTT